MVIWLPSATLIKSQLSVQSILTQGGVLGKEEEDAQNIQTN